MKQRNWIETDINTIDKLKLKLRNTKDTEIDSAITEGKKIQVEIEKLKKEEQEILQKRSREIEQEIIKISEEKDYILKNCKDLESTGAIGSADSLRVASTSSTVTGLSTTGSPQALYQNFNTTYNFKKKAEDWGKNIKKNVAFADNTIEIEMNGKKIKTTLDEADTMIGAICYNFGRISVSDFSKKVNSSSVITDPTERNTIITEFKNLKTNCFDLIVPEPSSNKNGDDRIFYMFGHELSYTYDPVTGKKTEKTNNKTANNILNMEAILKFFMKVGPRHDLTLVESLDNNDMIKNFNFGIMPVGKEASSDHMDVFALNLDHFYYPEQDFSKVERKMINSLKEWFLLFYNIYLEPENRLKSVLWMEGGADTGPGGYIIPQNPYEKLVFDLCNTNLNTYAYERNRPDGVGKEIVYCIDDISNRIRESKIRERELTSLEKLKDVELAKQVELLNAHREKIRAEEKKLEVESGKIRSIMEAEAASKKLEVTKDNFLDDNFDWTSSTNVLRAAAAKQRLIDIRYLKNDGDETGPLDSDLQPIWSEIEKRQVSGGWNAIIKSWFESQGTDLAARIAKVKGGVDGIALEVVREAYAFMGDTVVVEAIDKELKPDVPTTKLTKEGLNEALGITWADDALVSKWENFSGDWGKNKENIKGVINPHISDATKKGKLIEHLNKLPDSDGIDKTSDETKLTSFLKKEPKFIIETIVNHELEDTTFKASIIEEMKKWESTDKKKKLTDDYFSDGEPTEAGLKKFLYEKKLGGNYSTKDVEEKKTPEDGKDEKEKSWYDISTNAGKLFWIGGGSLVVIGAATAIFWKNISEWWNGPAEEGEKDDADEKEKDNE